MPLSPAVLAKLRRDREEKMEREKRKKDWVSFQSKKPGGDRKSLRIVPDPDPNEACFRMYALHYGFDAPVLCNAIAVDLDRSEQCPVCALERQLRQDWDNNVELINAIQRKDKAVYRVIVRGESPIEVRKFACYDFERKTGDRGIHNQILDHLLEPGGFDLVDVHRGHDLVVHLTTRYNFTIDTRPSALAPSQEEISALLLAAQNVRLDGPDICIADPVKHYKYLEELVDKIDSGEMEIKVGNWGNKDKKERTSSKPAPPTRASTSGRAGISKRPDCFANAEFYSPTDESCGGCPHEKECFSSLEALAEQESSDPVNQTNQMASQASQESNPLDEPPPPPPPPKTEPPPPAQPKPTAKGTKSVEDLKAMLALRQQQKSQQQ
jgi:hypothetical protein